VMRNGDAPMQMNEIILRPCEVARILNTTTDYVEKLIHDGELSVTTDSYGERGVTAFAAIVYMLTRHARRKRLLNELTRMGQEMGGYDLPEQDAHAG
jgi:excisionase family DNA binding protein